MKRLDCCVATESIYVENWCADALIIMNEPEYYAQRLILLYSWSGCALYAGGLRFIIIIIKDYSV